MFKPQYLSSFDLMKRQKSQIWLYRMSSQRISHRQHDVYKCGVNGLQKIKEECQGAQYHIIYTVPLPHQLLRFSGFPLTNSSSRCRCTSDVIHLRQNMYQIRCDMLIHVGCSIIKLFKPQYLSSFDLMKRQKSQIWLYRMSSQRISHRQHDVYKYGVNGLQKKMKIHCKDNLQ